MAVEDIIAENNNRAADAQGNAAEMANLAFQTGNNLLNQASQAIKLPVLASSALGSPGTVTVGAVPAYTVTYSDPGTVGLPPDLASALQAALGTRDAGLRNTLNTSMAAFAKDYCPGYLSALENLKDLLNDWTQSDLVSLQDYQRFVTVMENGIDTDRQAAQQSVMNGRGNGYDIPQPSTSGALYDIERGSNDAMARARSDVWAKAFELTWSVRQNAAGMLVGLNNGLREAILSYAQIITGQQATTLQYAATEADYKARGFMLQVDVLQAKAKLSMNKLEAEATRFNSLLASYKTDIEARFDAKRIEQANRETSLNVARVPFEAEQQRNIVQAQNLVAAMERVMDLAGRVADSWAAMAQASLSAMQANVSSTKQE